MRLALALAAVLIASPASVMAADSMTVAMQLGSVIASETFCGLSYDQSAIQSYIEKNVKADDMGFANTLQLMVSGQEEENKDLSPSGRTAQCAQIARVAKAYGFTK